MVTRRSGLHEAPSGVDNSLKQDNIQTVPVPQKIAEQARLRPEATALHFGDSDLSYAELQFRLARFAAYLSQNAKTSNGAVAICLERSSDWVIAALAIMRSGAAYVPLDPAWPEARLRYAIEASGAVALVARASMIDNLQLSIPAIDPLRDAAEIAKTLPLPDDEIAPESLAYIIYTSGSTGTPKGVEITHANLAHLVEWHCKAFAVTSADKASHLAGVAFDASAWELWPSLCVGAQICIPDDTVLLSPDLVRSWMLRERVTIGFVPSLYAAHMMEMEWPVSTALRFLLTGGDVLPQGPKKGLPFAVVNNYGPTECTVVATSTILRAGASETPPIGKPITGTTIYLLDEDQKKVPDGFPGEIYIGGDKVARGYRNQPELTRERFVTDPFASNANARLYRTGDRGELRPDGQIHFLGRLDRQTKIRGKRLELDEVGSVLSRHPNISMATVVAASEPGKDDKRLIAYVVFKHPEFTAFRDELASHLSQHLPEYMVPAAFVRLEQMPLTLNGKLDFTALPALSDANELKSAPKQKPATSLEQRLLAIIENLLHGKSIGIDDNVFLAGGDSLLGMQLMIELKHTFQVELRFDQIFEAPTVRDLAALIVAKASGNAEVMAPIEQQLLIIIQDLLHGKSISVNDNVFLAGGDSLLGMQLMIELKDKFKVDLRFDQIFEAATVHDLARLIQNMQKATPSAQNSAGLCTPMALPAQICAAPITTNIAKADPKDSRMSNGVLTLQKNMSSNPIFWVHYLNVNLDKALGQKRPVTFLILTPEDIEALGENPTLNNIAARFVEKILLTQPEGPYTLGGFCIGAVLAYEIAVQMRKAGHVVAHLMMLDAPGPSYLKMQGPLAPRLSNPLFIMKRMMKLGLRASWIRIRDRAIERLSKLGIGRAKIELQRGQTLIEIAASTYQGEVYGGKVLLLLAADNAPHINFLPEWQAIIPNDLNFEYIQAHHSELMVQPAVQRIADAIAAHLESAPAALSESFGSDINVALSSTTDQNGIPVPEPGTPGNLYPVMPAKQTFVRHESSQGK